MHKITIILTFAELFQASSINSMDLKKLMIRAISGAVYVGIIIGCIFWGVFPFSWMAAIFGALAVIEFEKITHEINKRTIPAMILDIAGVISLSFGWMVSPLLIWIFIIICRLIIELYIKSSRPLHNLAHSLMTQIYIGIPLGTMTLIGEWWNLHIVLALCLMIWINDTGAFLVGSTLGKHKLFERISPKKSWEGFFGGLVFNIAASYFFSLHSISFFSIDWNYGQWIGLGIATTLFATWGDLVESMIKRDLRIKDSGNIIPGHGGILDRIDSLLMVMPASLLYLFIFI